MIGGGKTEKEIIAELKKENRYGDWTRSGSKFGLITSGGPVLDEIFRDVRGRKVKVSSVTTEYSDDPNVDNIAVFEITDELQSLLDDYKKHKNMHYQLRDAEHKINLEAAEHKRNLEAAEHKRNYFKWEPDIDCSIL